MKKILFTAAIAVLGFTSVNAQEGFSAQAGLSSVTLKVDAGDLSISNTESGFFVGIGYAFEIGEQLMLEPSILYSSVQDLDALYVPVMFKYAISDKFKVLAGPQVNYILDDLPEGQFGLDIAAGLGYDITEKLFAQARYGFQVSRDIDNLNVNTLQIGIGYRF